MLVEQAATLDPALQNLYDYTKFHIGLYTTVFTAVVGALKLGSATARKGTKIAMGLALVAFAGAGACGGMIASHVPYIHDQWRHYGEFWDVPLSPSWFSFLEARCESWARYEHLAFWIGVVLCLVAVFIPRGTEKEAKGCVLCGRSS